jgi:hypothetical protein
VKIDIPDKNKRMNSLNKNELVKGLVGLGGIEKGKFLTALVLH